LLKRFRRYRLMAFDPKIPPAPSGSSSSSANPNDLAIAFLKCQYNSSKSSDPTATPTANLRTRSAFRLAHTDSSESPGEPGLVGLALQDLGVSGGGERGDGQAGATNLGDADLPGFGAVQVSDTGVPNFSSGLLLGGGGSFITKWVVVGGLAFRAG
jgi:hypothetical protein